jgi:hypothetical protein
MERLNDTRVDMLPDGWEVRYGLSPCVRAMPDSPNWDADNDGLGLFDEFRCCTSPSNTDTDEDGVNDGTEVAQGSCPSDALDNGDPANCVTLKLTVGDPSGSNSERWNMEILEEGMGKAVVCHCDDGFGTPGSARYALVKGKGSNADHADYFINGRRDLTDLFPVLVGVAPAITGTGAPLLYRIRQAGGAVSFIYTSLDTMNASRYRTHDITGCGAGLGTPLLSANITLVSADGLALSDAFVRRLGQTGEPGVILVEGKASSSAPLILDAVLPDGTVVASAVLPMRVAPVEQMYTRVNLRDGAAVVTPGTALPPAASGKNAIFVHGFRVDEENARGWHSEVCRRLWQSGSNARFHAVTWKGDIGGISFLFYHEDVASAFQTAPHLKDYVAGLTGQKIIMAQSLGNLVVSSAIADHGMGVDKYFMLNAAVLSEAHDAGLWSDSPGAANRMVHDEWRDYTNICWSAKWHEFFAGNPSDDRGHLTWSNRLGGVLAATTTYNIYSTGDQVFELRAETPPTVTFPPDRYTWQKQETHKGRGGLDPAGTSWAGWGFEHPTYETNINGIVYTFDRYPNAMAVNAAPPGQLRDIPVFRHNPSWMFTSSIPPALRNELLAKAIPALSPSAGNTAILDADFAFDMNVTFKPDGGVWGRDHGDYGKRWLHNDMREMAFFYTHKLFKHLVVQGDLQ